MSIKEYKKKRNFGKTPEPDYPQTVKESQKNRLKSKPSGHLRFVIQKHNASRLHYDLRLELDGVLKSWAVPKGPSLNPADKRLAMMVEDHPWEYRNFEGIIPEGNYGAGSVIVWDEGTYFATGTRSRKESEKALKEMFKKGDVKITFRGKRINGDYALVNIKSKEDNSWLLMKKKDDFATKEDVTKEDTSIKSGKTLEQLEQENEEGEEDKPSATNHQNVNTDQILGEIKNSKAKKSGFPEFAAPMLATLSEEVFDDPKWIFEVKWDGYRTIAQIKNGKVQLFSRNRKSFNQKFKPIAEALKNYKFNAVFDGEVVVLDENGRSDFQALQQYQNTGKGNLSFYIFDLLHFEGYDLADVPLIQRKLWLKNLLPNNPAILYSDHVEADGKKMYKASADMDLEGIIAKNANSTYAYGRRSKSWLKLKVVKQQEFVIGGYTPPKNSREHFGALLIGYFQEGKIVYAGRVGGGFSSALLKKVFNMLKPMETKEMPFEEVPNPDKKIATWVKPELVAEVKFTEWTSDGQLRHPIFLGMREDKSPAEVKKEEAGVATTDAVNETIVASNKKQIQVEGRKVLISNPEKILWHKEKITKLQMVEYYRSMAKYIVPYMKNRPQSLNRHPNGINGDSFYQKDMAGSNLPDWIDTVRVESESQEKAINYMLCQNAATLLYMANLGCIELNPWLSSLPKLDKPDFMVIDLDPEDIGFEYVIETALAVKEVLDKMKCPSVVKTSGSTGLHICVPLGAKYTYDQSVMFANLIATHAHQLYRKHTSIERSPSKRQKKVYIDYLQNRRNQTITAPYSLRPKQGATVSAPLLWEEVQKDLKMEDFNMFNMKERVKKVGDLWEPVLGKGIDMMKCLGRLEK